MLFHLSRRIVRVSVLVRNMQNPPPAWMTFDIDGKSGSDYHKRFLTFLRRAQQANIVIGGAMTDPKGDRVCVVLSGKYLPYKTY